MCDGEIVVSDFLSSLEIRNFKLTFRCFILSLFFFFFLYFSFRDLEKKMKIDCFNINGNSLRDEKGKGIIHSVIKVEYLEYKKNKNFVFFVI